MITQLPADVGEAALAGRERDTLVLTADERRWGRRRVTTTAGRTLALALPTGSVLRPGAVLHVAADWFLVVECAAEPCLAVIPASRSTGGFAPRAESATPSASSHGTAATHELHRQKAVTTPSRGV